MKKFYAKNFAYGAAALLVGAVGLTGCSSDDELTNVNPTYDGESVKTQFAINIPASGKQTRMSGENTQQTTGSFLGMQNIKLLPLTESATDNTALVQVISLGDIAKDDGLTDQHKIYTDVNIPVGTTNFLFYGEADGTEDVTTTTNAFAQGALKNTIASSAKASDITFTLLPVTTNKGDLASSKKVVLDAVNNVAHAGGWKTYADTPGNTDKVLTKLYNQFTTCTAGSAASVKLLLTDLKNQIAELAEATQESNEKTIAVAIKTEIEKAIGTDGNGGTLAGNTFPKDFNLPDGAAQLSWSESTEPPIQDEANWVSDATVGGTSMPVSLDLTKVCYPASLSYFVSTDLKSSNKSTPQWPTYTNWSGGTWNTTDWTGTSVTATTQAIALTQPIQYGVALLQTSVKCKTPTLEDNAQSKGGEPQNRIITVPTAGFPVTGILIGGQPDKMMWNFKPASDGDRTMTIYDNAVSGVNAGYNIAETKNYTLVLENTKTAGDADKVNVAIELTNNSGGDFYGVDGIIKNGATFYLVGQLDMKNLGTNGNNNANRTSVFEQDYTTVATFTISSLKNAYNCIPDLRGTQLSLGLAVDLEWKNGVVFDVTID